MKKKINFVLGSNANLPIGGYKIVFQYANELVNRNYDVSISFLFNIEQNRVKYLLKSIMKPVVIRKGTSHKKNITWFKLDKKIKTFYDVDSGRKLIDSDIIIATAAQTSLFVSKLPKNKGKKFYFIQNYENWVFKNSKHRVEETYCLGLSNIVISKELEKIVYSASGIKPYYLPNFYNPDEFFLTNPIELRNNTVALLNHIQETKRTKFGLEILAEVKKQVPDLKVELFGAYEPVTELADDVNFTYKATPEQLRNDIYGKSKIYLLPSVLEGWVLTGMEAMACGATVVSSRIGGIVDYANDGNSILIEPDNKAAFVKAIVDLLNDADKCEVLATKALDDVQKFRIDNSCDILERIIKM